MSFAVGAVLLTGITGEIAVILSEPPAREASRRIWAGASGPVGYPPPRLVLRNEVTKDLVRCAHSG